jgi:predicted nucleic acid-binding protein
VIHRIYLDANVFIYFIEGKPPVADPLRELFVTLARCPLVAWTSELTIAETLAPPRRADALPLAEKQPKYMDLLIHSGVVQLVPVDRDILVRTAAMREVTRHRLADAIHVASAARSNCEYFVSGDADAKRLPAGMSWIAPDRDGVRTIMEGLA